MSVYDMVNNIIVEKLKEGVDIKEDMLKLQAMLEKSQQSS